MILQYEITESHKFIFDLLYNVFIFAGGRIVACCSATYIDSVTKGESFEGFITLYLTYDFEAKTGTPLDLTGYSADGFITQDFNSADQTPLTILIDTPPTTGNIFFFLTELQVNALPLGINKLRIYWTTPTGERAVILESHSFTVLP